MAIADQRESAKLGLRRALLRANLGIGRDPAMLRLSRTVSALGIDRVLDVGANSGQFAALLRSAGFSGRIDSFEPLPVPSEQLNRRSKGDPLWFAHNVALGAHTGSVPMNVSSNSYSSSILTMTKAHLDAAPDSRVVSRVEVPVRTLAELQPELGFEARHTLLKIDTQGYEAEVLAGAGDLLASLAAVQMELSLVTLYEGQILFDELRRRMSALGLTLFSIEPGIADVQGRMLQCDGVFVRGELLAT